MIEKPQLPDWCAILAERWDGASKDWKDQLVHDLRVSPQTVYRWMQGKNDPDSKYKLTILEKYIPEISPALRSQFSAIYATSQDLILRAVAPVYARVHQALARTDAALLLETIVGIVLFSLVNHLDVEGHGIVAFMGQLLSAKHNGFANHLLINAWSACGTGMWSEEQARRSYSVDDDSLSALAAKSGRVAFYPRDKNSLAPVVEMYHMDAVQSAAAYPILRSGQCAGVIFLASTQSDYFTSHRREIIEQYALMISLAFRDSDFYPRSQINLRPADELQMFADYQQYMQELKLAYPGEKSDKLSKRAREFFRHSSKIM